ncbi:leukocyte receptor cluster member 1 homolog [Onthophagus taurus]|uniref:leukocyte receptor cluster member 1 homolog n=1 Tax=Onthophagus taurus TaxID=166361 RepID=UPI0039BDE60D
MNILPKKRWHVRTKENITRVRRDEAKAAEEERSRVERSKLAEREARTELLRQKARKRVSDINQDFVPLDEKVIETEQKEHVNFFKEVEDGIDECKSANKDHDKEKKEEQEVYEKKIGYLTYLGQDTHESLGTQSWYNVAPDRSKNTKEEVNMKSKSRLDPINIIKKFTTDLKPIKKEDNLKKKDEKMINLKYDSYVYTKEKHKKHKKHKKSRKRKRSTSSDESENEEERINKQRKMEIMRAERLKREQEERRKAEMLLNGKNEPEETVKTKEVGMKQKYNSQFNPELAKQNY